MPDVPKTRIYATAYVERSEATWRKLENFYTQHLKKLLVEEAAGAQILWDTFVIEERDDVRADYKLLTASVGTKPLPPSTVGIYFRGCPRCGGDAVWDPYEHEWRCVQCARRVVREDDPENDRRAGL